MISRTIATAIVFSFVIGCAVSNDDSGQDSGQLRQNEKVKDLYGPLVGTYSGKIRDTRYGDEKIEVIIQISPSRAKNPDGTPASGLEPYALIKRYSPIVSDNLFTLSYSRETGELKMISLGTSSIYSISAVVSGRSIVGPVQEQSTATLGTLDVQWVSSKTDTKNDLKERTMAAYRAIEGTYKGEITNGSKKPMYVAIDLTAIVTGDKPALMAFFRRRDLLPCGEVDLGLTVFYRTDVVPPQITMNGKGLRNYQIDIDGEVIGDTIEAEVSNPLHEGYLGHMSVKRVAKASSELLEIMTRKKPKRPGPPRLPCEDGGGSLEDL